MARQKRKPGRKAGVAKSRSRRSASKKTATKAIVGSEPMQVEAASLSEETTSADTTAVMLPEILDSSFGVEIKDTLLGRRGSPLVIDAGQVRRTGMQAVQVLLAAAKTWRADGQSYAIVNSTSEFLETLALVGLSREHLPVEGLPG